MDNKTEVPKMIASEVIDDIIANLSPETVPMEFVISAKLTLIDGSEIVVDGDELAEVLKNQRHNLQYYRVILDVRKIHNCIQRHTEHLLKSVFR